jgi:hypothetical protein
MYELTLDHMPLVICSSSAPSMKAEETVVTDCASTSRSTLSFCRRRMFSELVPLFVLTTSRDIGIGSKKGRDGSRSEAPSTFCWFGCR